MQIRKMKNTDIEKILPLTMACFNDTTYAKQTKLSFDIKEFEKYLKYSLYKKNCVSLLCIESKTDRILGFIHFICYKSIYSTKDKIAAEIGWHANPKLSKVLKAKIMIKLLKAALTELSYMDVKIISLTTCIKNNLYSFLGKHGFRHLQNNLVKVV